MPEDDLKGLFARQREANRQRAPTFHAMRTRSLEAPSAGQPAASARWWGWVAASVAVLVLAIEVLQNAPPHPAPRPHRSELLALRLDAIDAAMQKSLVAQRDLSAWQSSTDFLLPPLHQLDQP
jgi:hypothetical protein